MSTTNERRDQETFLIRIPVHFGSLTEELLDEMNAVAVKRLESEYLIIRGTPSDVAADPANLRFIRWQIPIEHSWPCNPRKMADFLERAAQTLASKFQESSFQTVLVGMLDPSAQDPFYRKMAMGLRGRIKQLLGERGDELCQAESQLPDAPTLFCMIGDSGLFAGIATPHEANGFYPGGSKFISHKAPHMISRAGAKVAEALHYIQLDQPPPGTGAHWLELGACPGGMTSELLQRSYKVTAVDRAPLDPRLDGKSGLKFVKADVADFAPAEETHFDAMLCDMNGESDFALKHVTRLSQSLEADGLVIFTLKTAGINGYSSLVHHFQQAVAQALSGGLVLITNTHLTTNRHEFTLFFSKAGSKPSTD